MRAQTETTAFRRAMLANLNTPRNRAKGCWKKCSLGYLLFRQFQEYLELCGAVIALAIAETRYERRQDTKSWQELVAARRQVLSEAADSANFPMMVADVCGSLEDQ